jgi:hypothetical protein
MAKKYLAVGDSVKIRPRVYFIARTDSYGVIDIDGEYMVQEMLQYCGKVAKLEWCDPFGAWRIDLDNGDCSWSIGMFENEKCVP